MRLTNTELHIIQSAVRKYFPSGVKVFLFGSRLDDQQRGGDIDLFISTKLCGMKLQEAKLHLMSEIQMVLGDQKIDVVLAHPHGSNSNPVVQEAIRTGVAL